MQAYEGLVLSHQYSTIFEQKELTAFKAIYPKAISWAINKYQEFYKRIYPELIAASRELKNSPIRLGGVAIDIKLFGIGCSLNYNSSFLEKENPNTK